MRGPDRKARRAPKVFAAILGLTIVGAFTAALIDSRVIEGSVPGESPILGLGVTDEGFLVGTSSGLFRSEDGSAWEPVPKLKRRQTLVTNDPYGVVVLVDKVLYRSDDLQAFDQAVESVQPGVALAADNDGNIYVAENAATFAMFGAESGMRRATTKRGPREIVALDALPGDPVTLYAGGLTSGFWLSTTGGATWRHILKTPVRALVADPEDPRRIFIGTAGGVLVSKDGGTQWSFTQMRDPIEAIAAARGSVFVLTQDRLLFSSDDGLAGYERVKASP